MCPGFGWRDQYVVKTGIQYEATSYSTLRLGYRHEWLPLRNHTTNTALNVFNLQTVADYITAGITCAAICDSEISAFGELVSPNPGTKYPQIAVDDFVSGDIAMASHNWAVGISVGKSF